jgi:allantoicase
MSLFRRARPIARTSARLLSTNNTPAFSKLTNLTSERFGSRVVFATDEWFATADNLLLATDPVWKEDLFTEAGKWMDGWETRRKRVPGHDWAIIKLGLPGAIHGFEVDTRWFTGNFTPQASVEAACFDADPAFDLPSLGQMCSGATSAQISSATEAIKGAEWTELVPMTELGAGYEETSRNFFPIPASAQQRFTHVRLNMFPDGGIARLRAYGEASAMVSASDGEVDLLSALLGAKALAVSDTHYGHPSHLLFPDEGINMGDGWETARKTKRPAVLKVGADGLLDYSGVAGSGDWCVLQLAAPGNISRLKISTTHFKGNFPESCSVEAAYSPGGDVPSEQDWSPFLPRTRLSADADHLFDSTSGLQSNGPVSHLRLNMFPDGGVMRMRAYGQAE